MDQQVATGSRATRTPSRPARRRWRLRARIARLLARLTWPIVRKSFLRREHRGFRLLTFLFAEEGMNEVAVARVALALDLIATVDPRRLARIRRDMPAIRVIRAGGGYFEASMPTCVVDWPAVMWYPVVHLAATIVHESTHARLDRMGIGYPAAWQGRIERRCLLEEVAFLRRLPDGGALAAEREAAIAPALATEWWAPHKGIERHIRYARAEGMPRWLIRLMERRRAKLAARDAARRPAASAGNEAPSGDVGAAP